jgi:hypothetical protein
MISRTDSHTQAGLGALRRVELSVPAALFPTLTLAFSGCAAMPPSTPAGGSGAVERNKALVRELTEVVWNQRGLDRIPASTVLISSGTITHLRFAREGSTHD